MISRAQIAETTYTAFAGTRDAVTARLIVRRIPDLNQTAVDGQGELFPIWRYHAAFTDSPFILVQAEAQHRGHAIIEQVFAELIDGPLAHLPSGRFDANNAWLTCIAHRPQPHPRRRPPRRPPLRHRPSRHDPPTPDQPSPAASPATPARVTIHLPEHWPWQAAFDNLFTAAHAPPG